MTVSTIRAGALTFTVETLTPTEATLLAIAPLVYKIRARTEKNHPEGRRETWVRRRRLAV